MKRGGRFSGHRWRLKPPPRFGEGAIIRLCYDDVVMLETPSATAWPNRLLILSILGLLLVSYVYDPGLSFSWSLVVPWAMLVILPLAFWFGDLRTVSLILVFLASYALPRLFASHPPLLVSKFVGVAVFLYLALLIPPLRRSLDWLRFGKWNVGSLILALVVIAASAGGLIGWVHFTHPEMHGYSRVLAGVPPRFVPVYMAGFAMINAIGEELVWRGVVMSALEYAFGTGLFSLLAQAVVFGMAHFQGGFPSGWSGAALAALFGLGMGLLRRQSKGLLVPWIAHSAADFVVISLIVRFANQHG